MKIENTFDEVLFAAVQAGLEPDASDLAQIRVPAGEDEAAFTRTVLATTREIAALRKQGNHGAARQIAAKAQNDYLAKFAALAPIPAGHADTDNLADIGARMFQR